MISGYNTDIDSDNITYHVQTEDKGLDTPFLLSLVYTGGEILASKRSPYDDLIKSGFDETILAERLHRQHKLICAAIKQGRIEDLKRMSMREPAEKTAPPVRVKKQAPKEIQTIQPESLEFEEPFLELPIALLGEAMNGFEFPAELPNDLTNQSARILRAETAGDVADFARAESVPSSAVNLVLLDEQDYSGGDRVLLRIKVTQNNERENVVDAAVVVKVLGSAFRPLIFHAKTAENGIASVNIQFPHFKSGRAALLIRAAHDGYEAELRRIVTQG